MSLLSELVPINEVSDDKIWLYMIDYTLQSAYLQLQHEQKNLSYFADLAVSDWQDIKDCVIAFADICRALAIQGKFPKSNAYFFNDTDNPTITIQPTPEPEIVTIEYWLLTDNPNQQLAELIEEFNDYTDNIASYPNDYYYNQLDYPSQKNNILPYLNLFQSETQVNTPYFQKYKKTFKTSNQPIDITIQELTGERLGSILWHSIKAKSNGTNAVVLVPIELSYNNLGSMQNTIPTVDRAFGGVIATTGSSTETTGSNFCIGVKWNVTENTSVILDTSKLGDIPYCIYTPKDETNIVEGDYLETFGLEYDGANLEDNNSSFPDEYFTLPCLRDEALQSAYGWQGTLKTALKRIDHSYSWRTHTYNYTDPQGTPVTYVRADGANWSITEDFSDTTAWYDDGTYLPQHEAIVLSRLTSNNINYRQIVFNFCFEALNMSIIRMIEEIHATIGASEYAYDDNGNPAYMSTSRRLEWLANAYGVAFNIDGSILSVPQRQNIKVQLDPNSGNMTASIPDGFTRGQFDDYIHTDGKTRLGILYQNRSNEYETWDDNDPTNNVFRQGDLVACSNMMQYFESFLEDLDKGLNWQEMGASVMPSADGTRSCAISGLGTLLAEVAYMLSSLSNNIYQSHVLALKTYHNSLEIMKEIGIPITNTVQKVELGDGTASNPTVGYIPMPKMAGDAPSLTQQIHMVLENVGLILGTLNDWNKPNTP